MPALFSAHAASGVSPERFLPLLDHMASAEGFHREHADSGAVRRENRLLHLLARAVDDAKAAIVDDRKQDIQIRIAHGVAGGVYVMRKNADRADHACGAHVAVIIERLAMAAHGHFALLLVHEENVDIFAADSLLRQFQRTLRAVAVVGVALGADDEITLYLQRFPDMRVGVIILRRIEKVHALIRRIADQLAAALGRQVALAGPHRQRTKQKARGNRTPRADFSAFHRHYSFACPST